VAVLGLRAEEVLEEENTPGNHRADRKLTIVTNLVRSRVAVRSDGTTVSRGHGPFAGRVSDSPHFVAGQN
jgi:hypothetical protein